MGVRFLSALGGRVLLPVVEQIDPTLVRECLWRAVSYRLNRPPDDFLLAMEPEYNDALLAAFVARYDREFGTALFPKPDRIMTPANREGGCRPMEAMTLVDLDKALGELKSDSPTNTVRNRADGATCISKLLPYPLPQRWNALSVKYRLWVPDDDYHYD